MSHAWQVEIETRKQKKGNYKFEQSCFCGVALFLFELKLSKSKLKLQVAFVLMLIMLLQIVVVLPFISISSMINHLLDRLKIQAQFQSQQTLSSVFVLAVSLLQPSNENKQWPIQV